MIVTCAILSVIFFAHALYLGDRDEWFAMGVSYAVALVFLITALKWPQ